MTQESIVLNTTPPYSGADLVDDVNDALQSLGTDFAGSTDPAAVGGVGPYMTWADTANGLLKRRNAADTAWVTIGKLLVDNSDAANIDYNNTASGLSATDVEGAIDEVALKAGQLINIQTFTTSGTYTPTAGTKKIIVEVVGGGGGGGAGNIDNSFGGGGAGGGYARKMINVSALTVPETVTIGAGGGAGAEGGGSSGGATSFGSHVSANGGSAGASASGTGYSTGGAGVNGDINISGGTGDYAGSVSAHTSGRGGCAAFYSNISPGSILGSGGVAGNGYGAGGGGGGRSTGTTRAGADGTAGLCIIWEYA